MRDYPHNAKEHLYEQYFSDAGLSAGEEKGHRVGYHHLGRRLGAPGQGKPDAGGRGGAAGRHHRRRRCGAEEHPAVPEAAHQRRQRLHPGVQAVPGRRAGHGLRRRRDGAVQPGAAGRCPLGRDGGRGAAAGAAAGSGMAGAAAGRRRAPRDGAAGNGRKQLLRGAAGGRAGADPGRGAYRPGAGAPVADGGLPACGAGRPAGLRHGGEFPPGGRHDLRGVHAP